MNINVCCVVSNQHYRHIDATIRASKHERRESILTTNNNNNSNNTHRILYTSITAVAHTIPTPNQANKLTNKISEHANTPSRALLKDLFQAPITALLHNHDGLLSLSSSDANITSTLYT